MRNIIYIGKKWGTSRKDIFNEQLNSKHDQHCNCIAYATIEINRFPLFVVIPRCLITM